MPTLIRPNRCETCAHKWRDGDQLFCRFNPPIAFPVMVQTPQGAQPVPWSSFAPVMPDWGCAKHARLAAGFQPDDGLAVQSN